MSVPISSHKKKRATGLNHWDEGESFLAGLDLQLGLEEELVQLGLDEELVQLGLDEELVQLGFVGA